MLTSRSQNFDASKRSLGIFSLTCLGLNSVIGSGILTEPGAIAQNLGPWAPLAFGLGGLLCLPIGLCFAEMARHESTTGGAYLYADRAFGPRVAFAVGWVIWLSGLIGGATVAVGFGQILSHDQGWVGTENQIGCAILTFFALVNLMGPGKGAFSNNFLAIAKLLPLFAFVIWSAIRISPSDLIWPPTPPHWKLAFIPGLLSILYSFSGFEEVPLPAGDVRNPEETVPRALLIVLAISTVFYGLIQGGVSGLGLAGDAAPLSTATHGVSILGPTITVATLLSLLSVNASIAFTAPRSLWAMADGDWLPPWLSQLDPKRLVPSRCIIINLALGLILAGTGSFRHLVELSVLAALAQHLVTCLACWKGRKNRLVPSIPMLATAICLGLLTACSKGNLLGLAEAILVGIAVSFVYRTWIRKSLPEGT